MAELSGERRSGSKLIVIAPTMNDEQTSPPYTKQHLHGTDHGVLGQETLELTVKKESVDDDCHTITDVENNDVNRSVSMLRADKATDRLNRTRTVVSSGGNSTPASQMGVPEENYMDVPVPNGLCTIELGSGVNITNSVWTTAFLKKGTVYGPYVDGQSLNSRSSAELGAWTSLIRKRSGVKSNMELTSSEGMLCVRTVADIFPGTELVLPFTCKNTETTLISSSDENPSSFPARSVRRPTSTQMNGSNMLQTLLECDKESKVWSDPTSYRKSGVDELPYICPECGHGFSVVDKFIEHKLLHAKHEKLIAKSKKPPNRNLRQKKFDAPVASQVNLNPVKKEPFKDAPKSPRTVKIYQCEFCERQYLKPELLKSHRRTHTGERNHKCKECGKQFSQSGSLRIHEIIHTGQKPYQCDQCNKAYSGPSALSKHKNKHSNIKPHQCPECDRHFSSGQALRFHMLTHSGEKPYKCEVCDRKFARSQYLQTHMLLHTGEKPHKCEECSEAFTHHLSLKNHMMKHKGLKPYVCPDCGKAFIDSSSLKAHMTTHTGERNYKCKLCEKSYRRSSHLSTHVKRVHPKGRPQTNDDVIPIMNFHETNDSSVCGQEFPSASELRNQKLSHLGDQCTPDNDRVQNDSMDSTSEECDRQDSWNSK